MAINGIKKFIEEIKNDPGVKSYFEAKKKEDDLKQLEEQEIIHQFPQLVEVSKAKVAQAEDTVFLDGKEKIITTN